MAVECHLPPLRATLVQVIHFAAYRGDGTPGNPVRLANYYFSQEGEMLACYDPLNGPPDSFMVPMPKDMARVTERMTRTDVETLRNQELPHIPQPAPEP